MGIPASLKLSSSAECISNMFTPSIPLCAMYVYAFMLCMLRELAHHLPVGFVGSSRTELLRHIRVPASERDGQ